MIQGKQISYSGPHIMLDCFGCSKEKLSDPAMIFNSLDTFPEKIGLEKIRQPYVFKYNNNSPEDWGITGIVLIADSHVVIHTFPEKNHAFVDIFSSKDFDTDFAVSYIKSMFDAKETEIQIASRGADFPGVPALAN